MLKTTYKPAQGPAQSALPPGWTEHVAPSGHVYYYNASTKKSTYVRPSLQLEREQAGTVLDSLAIADTNASHRHDYTDGFSIPRYQQVGSSGQAKRESAKQRRQGREQWRKSSDDDRPKHKQEIAGARPWVLVQTRYKRRFVHNPETRESLWKFPKDVMTAVIDMDRIGRERERPGLDKSPGDPKIRKQGAVSNTALVQDNTSGDKESDNEQLEYEVVDDGDSEDEKDDEELVKRRRIHEVQDRPVEFDEDDIAYQLLQLEQQDDDFEADGGWDHDGQALLAAEDAKALFEDLLNDLGISPFAPWDNIVNEGRIIDDDRYTALPNMRSRKETFDAWSRAKVGELKTLREQQAKLDPRVPFLAFLSIKATPKLYWPEFRRKYQKEPEMKDRNLSDKDKEKLYREHVARIKLPESRLKNDLSELLNSVPPRDLNKTTSLDALPVSILRDLRYISLAPKRRDDLVETFISTMAGEPPKQEEARIAEDEDTVRRNFRERERREKALANRLESVKSQQARQRIAVDKSRAALRAEEAEIDAAMKMRK